MSGETFVLLFTWYLMFMAEIQPSSALDKWTSTMAIIRTSLILLNLSVPEFIFRQIFTDEFPVSNMNSANVLLAKLLNVVEPE